MCPLCRRVYQPAKIKRLHVDRPDADDDSKELDLLQRLGLAWESSPEQLKEITEEVDAWLRDRPDDAVSHIVVIYLSYHGKVTEVYNPYSLSH